MKIGNAKLGQIANPNNLPWLICIFHKYTDEYDEFFEHVAFEPKAYSTDDKILANSSFGFKFSEISDDLTLPMMFRQYDMDKSNLIHKAVFYNQIVGWNRELQNFAIDYINCEDEEMFEKLIATRYLTVQDLFRNHENDHENSSICILKGLRREIPMYGNQNEWNNGLVETERKRG